MRQLSYRQSGMALLSSILLVVILLGVTGSALVVSVTQSKASFWSSQEKMAFYLAEAGLEASKYEIVEEKDTDGDGLGSLTYRSSTGVQPLSYSVGSQPLGDDLYRLTATGTVGPASVTLQVVVKKGKTTAFPPGAVSMVGELNKYKLKFLNNAGVSIDGKYSAAMTVTDKDLYDDLGRALAQATLKRKLRATLSGGVTSSFLVPLKGGTVQAQAPISLESGSSLGDLGALHDQMVTQVNKSVLPLAKTITGVSGGQTVLGSAEQPGSFFLDSEVTLKSGDSLSGHGTLIVNDLKLQKGASLNWEGTVIVIGNEKKGAKLEVQGGSLSVTGNVVVLGEGKEEAQFSLKADGQATVEGSLLLTTATDENKGKAVKVDTEGGNLQVNGLFSLLGGKIDAHFKHNSTLEVDGMVAIGVNPGPGKEQLKLEMEGQVDIVDNLEEIRRGVEQLTLLGAALNVPALDAIVINEMVVYAWYPVQR